MFKSLNIKKSGRYLQIFLVFSFLAAGCGFLFGAVYAKTDCETQAECEEELRKTEAKLEDLSKLKDGYVTESTKLEKDIAVFEWQIKKVQLGVRARNLNIKKLSRGIENRSELIGELLEKVDNGKVSLAELLRKTNELDATSLVELMLGYEKISDFFVDFDSFEAIHGALQKSFEEINASKKGAETEINELENQKVEDVQLRAIQVLEKRNLEDLSSQKEKRWEITEYKKDKIQQQLEETKKTAAEIRSRIFRLFGGGELSFGEAVKIAQFAGDASGIRAAFILAVLAQESAIDGIIGKNIGRCFYDEPKPNRSGTVMKNNQKPSFLAIMRDLGRDPSSTPVSCPIVSDGAYGGAMGPAQFMPTTWWDIKAKTGYKKRIAKITGNNPPSPFNNWDAFVGTSEYLKDAYDSKACRNYAEVNSVKYNLSKQMLQERCAAAKYYAGKRWYRFRWAYGEPVVERARQYQKDIDTLNR